MTSHVYIFWAGTRPLYVGCTSNLPQRMRQHAGRFPAATHISVLAFGELLEARRVEAHYIRKLRPAHNVRDNPRYRRLEDVLPDDRPLTAHERKIIALHALRAETAARRSA